MEQILQHLMQEKLTKGQLQLKSLWYISGGYISETYDYTIESGILSYLIYGPEIADNVAIISCSY